METVSSRSFSVKKSVMVQVTTKVLTCCISAFVGAKVRLRSAFSVTPGGGMLFPGLKVIISFFFSTHTYSFQTGLAKVTGF